MSYDDHLIAQESPETHNLIVGYAAWMLGILGSHRFYYGKPLTGLLWLCTGGLLLIGWALDLFLIPGMQAEAKSRYQYGPTDYTVTWLLFTFLGPFGAHRFYMRKWVSAVVYACTGGLFLVGLVYDLFTLNAQISEINVRDTLHSYDR